MKTRTAVFLLAVTATVLNGQSTAEPIAQKAIVTLKIPGFADFLVADGPAVSVPPGPAVGGPSSALIPLQIAL